MAGTRVALWQRAPGDMDEAGFCAALERVLAQTQADLVITPELCWPGYGDGGRTRAGAVTRDSALIRCIRGLAATHRRALVLGYAEAAEGALYNSALCLDAGGAIVANYRKRMMANAYERGCFAPGGGAAVFDLAGLPVAVLICYDVEFPELVRQAALAGAHLVIAPTALGPKWRIVADKVIAVRAYENGIFVAYCNFAAGDGLAGLSTVCGPDGQALVQAGAGPGVITAEIDSAAVHAVRAQLHFLRDLPRDLPAAR